MRWLTIWETYIESLQGNYFVSNLAHHSTWLSQLENLTSNVLGFNSKCMLRLKVCSNELKYDRLLCHLTVANVLVGWTAVLKANELFVNSCDEMSYLCCKSSFNFSQKIVAFVTLWVLYLCVHSHRNIYTLYAMQSNTNLCWWYLLLLYHFPVLLPRHLYNNI